MLDDVLCDLHTLDFVLAHGGRGWWYDAAGFLTLSNEHVWIELSGLPPSRLQAYYARPNRSRLARRMIFGTDSPGIPGIARNNLKVS
jgi:predicted TIM-barrel fold metal-dependent hydrolase